MADFCAQCSIEDFGEDSRDLAGFSTERETKMDVYVKVLCEGCGVTLVNHKGECVLASCLRKHGVRKPEVIPPASSVER